MGKIPTQVIKLKKHIATSMHSMPSFVLKINLKYQTIDLNICMYMNINRKGSERKHDKYLIVITSEAVRAVGGS